VNDGDAPLAPEAAEAADATAVAETTAAETAATPEIAAGVPAPRRGLRGLFDRLVAQIGRIPHPPLRSKRGLLIVIFLVAGFGSVSTVGGVVAISWTETADFCGRCHSMDPELKAYAMSPHREVPCAECHVEPGAQGWIKAKINGTRQLLLLLAGAYPKPIPAPDHAELPPTSETCVRCHDVDTLVANGGPVKLVLNARYRKDEPNTRDTIALVLRPAGFGGTSDTRGVHWHIDSEVDYTSQDPRAQKIDWVGIKEKDGTYEQYIAASEIGISDDVQPDIDRLKSDSKVRRMDCIDCHNRTGHGIPTTDQSIDAAITGGKVAQDLPYIKKEASELLSIPYASIADADNAIAGLNDFYATKYPLVPKLKDAELQKAITSLQGIYRLVATPEMQVTAATYPNNLGHQSAPGCFRCHDGAHYKVVDGAVTKETIPASCATCHTFPQIGATESGVLIGQRPNSHDDRLWVFNHKSQVASADPTDTTCGACHTRTYCENCHNTPASKVPHDDMVYNHASVVAKLGATACASCHQPVYCAQCHSNDVLPNPYPDQSLQPSPSPASP
jgi:nitrate/TMAO reductase-like tetraheme cytochrome c subunit